MLLDIINVFSILLLILGVIFLCKWIIDLFFIHHPSFTSLFGSLSSLIVGIILFFFVFFNHNNIITSSNVYANSNRPVPLTTTLMNGASVDYHYDKRYLRQININGEVSFKIKDSSIKGDTVLTIIQNYRDNFGVNTLEEKRVLIHVR